MEFLCKTIAVLLIGYAVFWVLVILAGVFLGVAR